MTPEDEKAAFLRNYREICQKAGEELFARGEDLYLKMSAAERSSFLAGTLSGPGGYLLPKIVLCAIPAERIIHNAFAAESMLQRIYNSRIG